MNQMVATGSPDLISALSARYGMQPKVFEETVRATCFPADPVATPEEFMAGMAIANRLDLNPLIKEVHFARQRGGGVVAIIGADGWYTLANRQPTYDGCEFDTVFTEPTETEPARPYSITCRIFDKKRGHPTEITEYFAECYRDNSTAWKLTPLRMLRHRAFGQCCRIAFGLAGVMEYDEFLRWQEQAHENEVAAAKLASPVRYENGEDKAETKLIETKAEVISQSEKNLDPTQLKPPAPPPPPAKKSRKKAEVTPEPVDDPLVDQDAYLGMLEESMAACRDAANLDEVWSDHQAMQSRLSLENQRNADNLRGKHARRLEKQKS